MALVTKAALMEENERLRKQVRELQERVMFLEHERENSERQATFNVHSNWLKTPALTTVFGGRF